MFAILGELRKLSLITLELRQEQSCVLGATDIIMHYYSIQIKAVFKWTKLNVPLC